MKKLILVCGRPGTGKTYIAKKISERDSKIKLISYDDLKEKNYDEYGFDNIEEKEKLNLITLKEFLFIVEKNMILGNDIISEYPFSYKQKNILEKLSNIYGYKNYTVRLIADENILLKRIVERDTKYNGRHLGHIVSKYHKGITKVDRKNADYLFNRERFTKICKERDYDNFKLGDLYEIDTTTFENLEMNKIYSFLEI
ncbi:AAA family ATPase [Oceanivirga salmonicida]|uniref:AAA family ATPase n=1 Tax=Oceanivirga salmonicida TaxID=1769291 RepID=UPI0008351EC4|nr:AAA family ATPase [Oceanivirga salmonicida]